MPRRNLLNDYQPVTRSRREETAPNAGSKGSRAKAASRRNGLDSAVYFRHLFNDAADICLLSTLERGLAIMVAIPCFKGNALVHPGVIWK